MTPLEIEILLHYYACTNDYHDGDFGYPAVHEAIGSFQENCLIQFTHQTSPRYEITDRGRAMVDALRAVPLPIWQPGKWITP